LSVSRRQLAESRRRFQSNVAAGKSRWFAGQPRLRGRQPATNVPLAAPVAQLDRASAF
jgi:hypothetical protein